MKDLSMTDLSMAGPPIKAFSIIRRLILAAALGSTLWISAGIAHAASFVVHLPTTPIENAGRRAEAIQQLAEQLNASVPGLKLEPQIFRRFADAEAYLASEGRVVLLLSDAAWVPDLPARLVPSHSVVKGSSTSYRRQLVAKGRAGTLSDLRGKRLATVVNGAMGEAYVKDRVFGGELDPAQWFGALRPATDDSEVVADILYGDADAGLVAEFNPLLAQHLGQSLKLVYTSGDLPLPVLSVSTDLDRTQRQALEAALASLPPETLAGLGFNAFKPLDAPSRSALRRAPSQAAKRFELPAPPGAELDPLPPPDEALLPLVLELPLPEPPSAAGELLAGDAGQERN